MTSAHITDVEVVNPGIAAPAGYLLRWLGWKDSGLGHRMVGPDGIRKYCRTQAVVSEKLAMDNEMHWYPYSARKGRITSRVLRLLKMHDWRRRLGLTPKDSKR